MYSQKHYETEFIKTKQRMLREGKTKEAEQLTCPVKGILEPHRFVGNPAVYDRPTDDTIIIRYMSYSKFIYLIQTASLYMCIPQQFSQDQSEGYIVPEACTAIDNILENAYAHLLDMVKNKGRQITSVGLSGIKATDIKIMNARWRKVYKHNLKRFFISCWTERDCDQDNMWRAYIRENERDTAVAVKTTVGKLKNALRNNPGCFLISRIKYVDLDRCMLENAAHVTQGVWEANRFMLTLKDRHYADDREIRLLTDSMMSGTSQWYRGGVTTLLGSQYFDYGAEPDTTNISLKLDLENMIDEIILSPSSREGFGEEVKDFLRQNGLHDIKISKSNINKPRPMFGEQIK